MVPHFYAWVSYEAGTMSIITVLQRSNILKQEWRKLVPLAGKAKAELAQWGRGLNSAIPIVSPLSAAPLLLSCFSLRLCRRDRPLPLANVISASA